MNEAFIERVNIEKHLRTALQKNEFEIYYQPQTDLRLGRITGFEALLRWNSRELGSVPPLKFIKAAEDTHLIIPLGAWVFRNACIFLIKLHKKGHTDLTVSVNISMQQLLQTNFNDMVMETLESVGLEPGCIELEITESTLMESYEAISRKLNALSKMGIKIAMDDFGKGYSSLSHLKQLPISILKKDKSFIDDIACENTDKILAGQIVMLGKSMGMCVVAEGVETREQLEYLAEYGCRRIQGYLYAKPMAESEIEVLLEAR